MKFSRLLRINNNFILCELKEGGECYPNGSATDLNRLFYKEATYDLLTGIMFLGPPYLFFPGNEFLPLRGRFCSPGL